MRFFNPYEEIRFTENLLPHWQQAGAVHFITFRLADALPARLLAQWEDERTTWLRFHPKPWTLETEDQYHKRFSGAGQRCARRRTRLLLVAANRLRKNNR